MPWQFRWLSMLAGACSQPSECEAGPESNGGARGPNGNGSASSPQAARTKSASTEQRRSIGCWRKVRSFFGHSLARHSERDMAVLTKHRRKMADANCVPGLSFSHFIVRPTVMECKIRRKLGLVIPGHFIERFARGGTGRAEYPNAVGTSPSGNIFPLDPNQPARCAWPFPLQHAALAFSPEQPPAASPELRACRLRQDARF